MATDRRHATVDHTYLGEYAMTQAEPRREDVGRRPATAPPPEKVRDYRAGTAALAACAGAVDLLALTKLGGAFASIVTGNLVTLGFGLGAVNAGKIAAVVIAVAGYGTGVALWARIWRSRPAAVFGPLGAELALLVVLTTVLLVTDVTPATVTARVLLAVAALAMGGQSVAGLRLKATTTYLTGAFATAINDAVAGRRTELRSILTQLVALVAGAAVTAALLGHLPWAAAVLPPVLLSLAIVLLRPKRGTR